MEKNVTEKLIEKTSENTWKNDAKMEPKLMNNWWKNDVGTSIEQLRSSQLKLNARTKHVERSNFEKVWKT